MSCVVGLIKGDKLFMGSDGRASTNDGEIRPINAEKLFWNDEYLIGFAGGVRTGQLLKPEYFEPPDEILKMPNAIMQQLANFGSLATNEDQISVQNSNILIGFKGKLYEILVDFQMNEVYGDYLAIGSGAPYALGSLYSSKRVRTGERRVLMALKAAAEFDGHCGPPYFIESME